MCATINGNADEYSGNMFPKGEEYMSLASSNAEKGGRTPPEIRRNVGV